MLFTTTWLSRIFTEWRAASHEKNICQVSTDSRKQIKDALFVPLQGENFDGHHYAMDAVKNGAEALLWEKDRNLPEDFPEDIHIFYVPDTLKGLQELASQYRKKIDPTVIGITGSNGKTTTKDMVAAVVSSHYRTHYTAGNLNNQIGVPLTILDMPPETEVLILEMGMNHFGEIARLSEIGSPDYAIITNIGESHIEYLGSRTGIAQAKLEIVTGMNKTGCVLMDGDEPLLSNFQTDNEVITCGFHANNEVMITDFSTQADDMRFTIDGTAYRIPLPGKHHALNATFAVMIGTRLEVPLTSIQHALETFPRTGMRFEKVMANTGATMINDAYNASPTSMRAAIQVIQDMHGYTDKVLVLGDIFELGDSAVSFHRAIAEAITDEITALFTYGRLSSEITYALQARNTHVRAIHFTSQKALLHALEPYMHQGAIILFKASRGMQFEALIDDLLRD